MLHSNFVIIGSIISAIGNFVYLIETIKGKIKPNRVTNLLWAIVPFIIFFAQLKQGVGLPALLTFVSGFMPLMIFVSSFVNKNAEWKLTRFDLACGALSVIGIVLWLVTRVGNIAIFFSIIADALGAIPTVVKSYKYPDTELAWPFLTTGLGAAITLFTIERWTFANSGFALYLVLITFLIFSLVQFRIGLFEKKTV